MTDNIIRMAKEAGLTQKPFCRWGGYLDDLVRFAALVAAAEREACAAICDEKAKETFSGQCQVWGDHFARAIRKRSEP